MNNCILITFSFIQKILNTEYEYEFFFRVWVISFEKTDECEYRNTDDEDLYFLING